MIWWAWLLIAAASCWIFLVLAFLAVAKAQEIQDQDHHWFFGVPIIVGGSIGFVLDVAFNLIATWVIFGEPARKDTFSRTVEWHCLNSSGRDLRRALWWGRQLNKYWAGHIDLGPHAGE